MIPLVDISDVTHRVAQLEQASRDIGFVYISGHGIPSATINRVRTAVIEYFSRPRAEKDKDCISPDNYRGYIPLGFFNPNSGDGAADQYEGYKLHYEVASDDPIRNDCDLYGPNKWPASPVHFRASVLEYWRECDRVAQILLEAFAQILGVDQRQFLSLFEYPLTNMTLLHYPPQAANADGVGIHPHKDTDALTILANDPVGGLEVQQRGAEKWLPVKPPGDALTVNIGDMLELWSGGYLVSTPHRVVNKTGAERYSFPYFAVPRHDSVVEPLRPTLPNFDRGSIHVGDASREVWRSNWQDAKPVGSNLDLAILE